MYPIFMHLENSSRCVCRKAPHYWAILPLFWHSRRMRLVDCQYFGEGRLPSNAQLSSGPSTVREVYNNARVWKSKLLALQDFSFCTFVSRTHNSGFVMEWNILKVLSLPSRPHTSFLASYSPLSSSISKFHSKCAEMRRISM